MFTKILLLNIKTFAQQKIKLIVLFLLCLFVPFAVGLIGNYFLTQGSQAISIAIVDLDDGFETRMILSAITEDAVSGEIFEFIQYSYYDAALALENGHVAAVITFPQNFGHSMIIGENIPFTILYNSNMPFQSAMVHVAAEAFADMLRSSQMGVYVVLNFARTQDITNTQFDIILMAINMIFINLVLARVDVFNNYAFVEGMTIWQVYFVAMYFALILCAMFVMTNAIRGNLNKFVITRLNKKNIALPKIFFACLTANLVLILPINLIVALIFSQSVLILLSMIIISLGFASFGTMVIFLFNNDFLAGSFSAIFVGTSLFFSGGIIPSEFFGGTLQLISNFIFNTWAVGLMSSAYAGLNILNHILVCILFTVIFSAVAMVALYCKGVKM